VEFKCGACEHRWSEQFSNHFVVALPSSPAPERDANAAAVFARNT